MNHSIYYDLPVGAICPVDILKNTNNAEMQVNKVDNIRGSAGWYAKHNCNNLKPEATDGLSLACNTRLKILSKKFDRASHSW